MLNNFKSKSKLIKITHTALFIITVLYLLECIFILGLFTNPILACINILVGIITLVIAIIKKETKLAFIDLAILLGIATIFIYLIEFF